ncbi:MAG: hypothetical protein LH645_07565 [Actinomycetia bacterium]|nr:hypothetical protein [Actinomycetes bacterium]
MLAFDVETRVDHTQALRFGNWQYCRLTTRGWQCVDEGRIYDDALPTSEPEGFSVLRRYAESRRPATDSGKGRIRLLSRDEFVRDVFLPAAYEGRARVVGFNLAFDLSRVALRATTGRGRNHESFAFVLRDGNRAKGYSEYMQVPRLRITHADAHRNDIVFTKPYDSKQPHWSGDFVDVHTLVHALTGKGHSLASACEAFGVEGKDESGDHGRPIDADYIDYCRQDVAATRGLYVEAVKRLDSLGLPVTPPEVKSAATLAKRTLEALGVEPIAKRMPDLDLHGFGIAMTAFYGGRAECRIRHVPVPVRLVDFTSTYPTLFALLRMWGLVIAERWEQVDCTEEIWGLLEAITVDDCFDPDLWPRLVGFALVAPDDDVLPVRAQYDPNRPAFGIGVNHLTSAEPLWYPLPDVIASTLITGRPPRILKAFRVHPDGVVDGLTPLTLPGGHVVDSAVDDPWKAMVEQRQRIKADKALDPSIRTGQEKGLKVASNSGAYGIWSEYNSNTEPGGKTASTTIYDRHEQPWTDEVRAPETPGKYCAPPIAAVVTSGARLLLTLLERCVTDLGGSWAMADTDSMAIVANEHGGLLDCPGGSDLSADGDGAIRVLTYQQVKNIRHRFVALNPYDHSAVPGSVLEHEADAHCYAIAAKRYALFTYDPDGVPRLVPNKVHAACSHGLGHALNPYAHDKTIPRDRWVRELWEYHLAREVAGLDPEEPE